MSDADTNKLLSALQKSTEKAKRMSQAEAQKQLIKEGFYTKDGKLAAKYGGTNESVA